LIAPVPVPKGNWLKPLKTDGRQGAQHLAKQISVKRWRKELGLKANRLHNLLRFRNRVMGIRDSTFIGRRGRSGHGRPLAGPVVAGAVILPRNYKLRRLNDSEADFLIYGGARGVGPADPKQDAGLVLGPRAAPKFEEIDNHQHLSITPGLLAMATRG